ncbi:MAG: sigma 54-interacting transcriptional regulator, partial [Desulfobacterales bacterium]|nr:sigma 54-interacting transcriptional regulator [Desulfobacterales bacterium]
LDNLKDGIIAHDIKRRIFFFNHEAERITGFNRKDVLGRDCHEVFGVPFCGERCCFSKDNPEIMNNYEYTINSLNKKGEIKNIEMSFNRMDDENGKLFGVIAFLRDVTDILSLKIRAGKLNSFANIIGQDTKMLQLFQQIRDVAYYNYPVHISGETGTGKELVAAAIHNEGQKSGAPFIAINCGALPESLIESELFGHVKGAFSDAIRDKKGRFELANKGTIFLDEVTELSKNVQVKLLRFLQEGTFEKVGGEKTISVNIRVISATNKDLKKEVKNKNFREDLYYRLNVIPISIPPLRERKNDIPLLVNHFLKQAEEDYKLKPPIISKDAMSLIMNYAWPGNVRELQNAIQFAIVKCSGNLINSDELPVELRENKKPVLKRGPSRKLDFDTIKSALEKTGWNKSKAAKLLGVGRATLYRFLSEHPEILKERGRINFRK